MEKEKSELPSQVLTDTLSRSVLELEEIDKNLYRGSNLWKPHGTRGVFGGQVIGQALVAAGKTIEEHWHVHSVHGYFLHKGNDQLPILYEVERVRDGKKFSARLVKAVQNGVILVNAMVSYHIGEQIPVESQPSMPTVPPPEELSGLDTLFKNAFDHPTFNNLVSEKWRDRLKVMAAQEVLIDIRPIHPKDYFLPRDKQMFWVKTKGPLGNVHNNLHRCVAAYSSDLMLLGTTLLQTPLFRPSMIVSLDHSMWFHCPFRADEWMLYELNSQRLLNGRGLAYGRLWTRDGQLAISVAQEGVVRGQLVQGRL